MARELWAKLHVELLDDGKLYERSDSDFRLWVSLILLAKMTTEDGVIHGMGADSLRKRFNLSCSAIKVQGALDHFAASGMVKIEKGAIKILNYEKRQAVKDYREQNAERQRRWRGRNVTNNGSHNVTDNGDVTTEENRREEKRRDLPPTPSRGRPLRGSKKPSHPKSPEQQDAEDRAAAEAELDHG